MHVQQQHQHTRFAASPRRPVSRSLTFAAAFVAVVLAAKLCSTGNYREAAVVAAVALGAALLVSLRISVEAVLIAWFATTPLASFYIRFPIERPIVTYNRVVFAAVVGMLLMKWTRAATSATAASESAGRATFSISKFELSWVLLSILALASAMAKSYNVAYATRMAVDTFGLPVLAFHVARNHFDLAGRGKLLILAAIALALFLFVTGAFEFATGTNLFACKGAEIIREGERRVNGPFESDSSYAISCLMLFLFLRAAPRLFRVRLDRGARLVYGCALAGAALGALMPLFRAVAIALIVGWLFLRLREHKSQRSHRGPASAHRIRLDPLFLVILIVLAGWAATMVPSILPARLADPRTAYGRLATWKAAAEIALDNAILGVGLGNYSEYFDRVRHEEDEPIEEVLETRASRDPHSNPLWIGAELGLIGLALYIAANAWLFLIGWRALKRSANKPQRVAAACFLALVVGYQIPGLTLASGYYSDLNLCFFFLLGVLSNPLLSSQQSVSE